MARRKKNNKLKKQIKDAFILTIMICAIIYVLYIIISLISSPVDIYTLKESTIYNEESKVGYVIRDETIIESTNEDNEIEPIKKEGEKVALGKPVFKYYNIDEDSINKQIEELNQQIQEALLGQTDLFSSDVKSIEGQIEKELDNLKNENNMQDILEYKSNISDYIVKKAKIAGNLSVAGEYINNLISQRNSLEKQLTNGANYVCSSTSGVVSYRIDNLESKLTKDKLEELSIDYLNKLKLTTAQIVGKSTKSAKVINNFEAYIAVPFEKSVLEQAKEGQEVVLRLSNKEEINAEIYKIKEENNNVLVIFKITDGVENLINYRKISLDVIWWRYSGLVVPKNTIVYENGLSYVIRRKNANLEKVLVEIIKENENYYIIDNYGVENLSKLGYTTSEINKIKTIKLYDEIVINPEI